MPDYAYTEEYIADKQAELAYDRMCRSLETHNDEDCEPF